MLGKGENTGVGEGYSGEKFPTEAPKRCGNAYSLCAPKKTKFPTKPTLHGTEDESGSLTVGYSFASARAEEGYCQAHEPHRTRLG